MKNLISLVLVVVLCSSCSSVLIVDSKPKKAPPGQVKKLTGSQSAAPYAPGQQKKKN